MVVVAIVVVLRRTWQAAWEVELRGRLLRPFFYCGCFVEAKRPLLEKYPGSTQGLPWVYPESSLGLPRAYPGSAQSFPGSTQGAPERPEIWLRRLSPANKKVQTTKWVFQASDGQIWTRGFPELSARNVGACVCVRSGAPRQCGRVRLRAPRQCEHVRLRAFPGSTQDLPRVYPGSSLGLPRVFPRST